MAGKRGNLRVRKGSSLFGPMSRADLVKLLEAGRVAESDQVSADDGPWQAVGTYLARTAEAAVTAEPQKSSAWTASSPSVPRQPPGDAPTLRVLKESRVFPMMTRQQVSSLLAAGRLTGDELICALNGPWMCVADFFAHPAVPTHTALAPVPSTPAARFPAAASPPAALSPASSQEEDVTEVGEDDVIDDDEPVTAEVVEEEEEEEVLEVIEEDDEEESSVVPVADTAYQPRPAARPATPLSNQWYVKVRGMHSAPLQKHHIKMLLAAREIDNDAPACHVTWRSESWISIKDIPELADLVKRP